MRQLFLIPILIIFSCEAFAQSVGIGTTSPKASAALDISSTNKGLLIPRMTTALRKVIPNPAIGLVVFDTDKNTIYMFTGADWKPFAYEQNENRLSSRLIKPGSLNALAQGFGFAASISGNHAIVGSPLWDPPSGSNGLENYGEVYFYQKKDGFWNENTDLNSLNISGISLGAQFGYAIAIDGDFAVVGAPFADVNTSNNEGKVFVLKRNTGTNKWAVFQELTGSNAGANDNFGTSVSISGNALVVGAPGDDISIGGILRANQGSVYVFKFNGSTWVQTAKLYDEAGMADDAMGASVAIDTEGNTKYLIAGAPGANIGNNADEGAAYCYLSLDAEIWIFMAGGKITLTSGRAGDAFGTQVAARNGGFVVGAPFHDNIGGNYSYSNTGAVGFFMWNGSAVGQTYSMEVNFYDIESNIGKSLCFKDDFLCIGFHKSDVDGLNSHGYVNIYEYPIVVNYPRLYRQVIEPNNDVMNHGKVVAISGYDLLAISNLGAHFVNIE